MAEEALKKIDEQLNCSICLDTYTDPKLLQCFHVYCRQCLVPLVDRNQEGQLGLTCPNCRQVTPIPDRGVAGLQPAFHINRFLEIKESLQKPENPAAEALPTDVDPVTKASHCSTHEGKELELYCETCQELICLRCVIKGGKHQSHHYEELDQAFEKYKIEIASLFEPMEKQVKAVKKTLALLDAHCEERSDQRAATAVNIHKTFRQLREVLTVRETELIGQLDQVTQGKLKGLAVQRDQVETTLAQLYSCRHFMRDSLRAGNEKDVLMMKTSTVKKVTELTAPFQNYVLDPDTEADTVFSAPPYLTLLSKYGKLLSSSLPDPSRFQVDTKVAEVEERCSAVLKALNFKGEPCKESIKSLKSEIISEITGTRAACDVEGSGQSQYVISYCPTIKGRHQLHITVEGQHIRGSPFAVLVKSPIEMLGTLLLEATIGTDRGMAINQKGEVVATSAAGRVAVFRPNGEEIRSIGDCYQFTSPCGVVTDGEGNILVVDQNSILKFTSEGQVVTSVGTEGSGHLQFSYPWGIAFNASSNKVYVTEVENHRVQVLNFDMTFFSTFGMKGNGEGEFESPHGIACDSTGKVYVADSISVQVFTAMGEFIRLFGDNNYVALAIDTTTDLVYVTDVGFGDHHISVFTSEGDLVTSFGPWGYGPGEFIYPERIAVDNCGVVYISDNNGLQLF